MTDRGSRRHGRVATGSQRFGVGGKGGDCASYSLSCECVAGCEGARCVGAERHEERVRRAEESAASETAELARVCGSLDAAAEILGWTAREVRRVVKAQTEGKSATSRDAVRRLAKSHQMLCLMQPRLIQVAIFQEPPASSLSKVQLERSVLDAMVEGPRRLDHSRQSHCPSQAISVGKP